MHWALPRFADERLEAHQPIKRAFLLYGAGNAMRILRAGDEYAKQIKLPRDKWQLGVEG